MVIQATIIHANTRMHYGWLEKLIVSPRFHHWHHASDTEAIDKNYAATFPVIDRIFGTYHLPLKRWPLHYGTVTGNVPELLIAQQAFPFKQTHR